MADDQLFQRFGKEFPPGTVLFREGAPGKEMYVVQHGRITISKQVGEVEKILASPAEKVPKGPAGHKLEIRRGELAGRVGVKPEDAEEVLSKLLKSKIVTVQPDGFLVADVAKLRHFLEFLQMKAQFGDIA